VLEVTSIAKLAITSIPEIETSFLAVCVAFTGTDITIRSLVGVDEDRRSIIVMVALVILTWGVEDGNGRLEDIR
jgi:hypothetical protein